jgi:NADH-quinone oxidoreductase subunit M
MVNHGLSTGALFLLVGMIYDRYHTRRLSDFGGLAGRLPGLGLFLIFICLSSIGLPGLNGFVGEVLCLLGMFAQDRDYAVVGAIGIILGAWYLLGMVQHVLFGRLKEPEHGAGTVPDLNAREIASLAPIALLCLWIGLYPRTFLAPIEPEVRAIVKVIQAAEARTP